MADLKMKRNTNCSIRQKREWVSVEFNPNEFEDLNGVEELTDYELVRENARMNSPKLTKKKARICFSSKEHKHNSTNNNKSSYAMQKSSMNVNDKKREQKRKPGKKHKKQKGKNYEMPLSVKDSEKSQLDMSAWDDCFVPEPVKRALSELGFSYPTPIQALTLPSAIRDKLDILGAAETGSGKTLAFGIPLIHFILEEKTLEMNKYENEKDLVKPLRALVITPTRELAIQVRNHLRMAAKYTDIKVEAIVGGMCLQKQERLLRLCPDIVVGTPGRLWELIEEGNPHLSQISEIRMLVVDEADRMVEKGHFAELLQIAERINKSGSTNRKTYIFSATLTLVHDIPKRILLKRKKFKMTQENKLEHLTSIFGVNNKYKVIDLSRKVGTVESLTESRIHCSLQEKDVYLCYFLMTHPGRTLVFCNSIDCVRRLKSILTILDYSPYPLHASLHQRQRLKNLDRFTSDSKSILLATDVAARGLDIVGIEHIIHYQIPHTAEVYVHRSGRTARAERQGHSLMLIEPKEIVYYRRLCKSLNRDEDIPIAQVNNFVLRAVKERIVLARIIDKLEHSQRKSAAHNNWLLNAAREIEVEVDDDELMAVKQPKQELTVLKKRLKIVMQKPILQMTL